MASSIISWKITYQHNNRLVIEINLGNTLEEKPEGVYELSETITNPALNKTVDIDLTIKDDRPPLEAQLLQERFNTSELGTLNWVD